MRILVCPLNWGLGHATRCVPVINHLLEKGIEVVIGADGAPLHLLKAMFPNLKFILLEGYRISYSPRILPVSLSILLKTPGMLNSIKREHNLIEKLIKSEKIDAIISDNRYGLWSSNVPSVFITHQLNIRSPFMSPLGQKYLSKKVGALIKPFTECWIPDYAGEYNLSGELSHPIPDGINAKYIGPLSRFKPIPETGKKVYDLLVILSGPEPQRTILEESLIWKFNRFPFLKKIIVCGMPENTQTLHVRNTEVYSHLPDNELRKKIQQSNIVLSRSGYTTIMDLHACGWKKAIFVPTPSQTEQEYLASRFESQGLCVNVSQSRFSLEKALTKANNIKCNNALPYKPAYREVIDGFIANIKK
jgi:uncharacterized protein (TIGR00661 family)